MKRGGGAAQRSGRNTPVPQHSLNQQDHYNHNQQALYNQQVAEDEDEMGPPRKKIATSDILSKLEVASLRKYRLVYSLGRAPPSAGKQDLLPAVVRHFSSMVLEEEEVLIKFAQALQRKQHLEGKHAWPEPQARQSTPPRYGNGRTVHA